MSQSSKATSDRIEAASPSHSSDGSHQVKYIRAREDTYSDESVSSDAPSVDSRMRSQRPLRSHATLGTVRSSKFSDSSSHSIASQDVSQSEYKSQTSSSEKIESQNGIVEPSKSSDDVRVKKKELIRIYIQDPTRDRAFALKVSLQDKVTTLKKAIMKSAGPTDETSKIRLIFMGKILDDDRLISDYGLRQDCTVHFTQLPSSPENPGIVREPQKTADKSIVRRAVSLQNVAKKSSGSLRRSNSMFHKGKSTEKPDIAWIPCDAMRYSDNTWHRGERGPMSSKGYLVRFVQDISSDAQDTVASDIKLRPWWWRALKEEDIISLEPLNRLKYEPFELHASEEKVQWFDGKVLANYLISSANFVHPVSRRPLERSEMVRLDEYLKFHSLGNAMVVHVFDKKDDSSENTLNHLSALRREASDILGAIFATRRPDAQERRRDRVLQQASKISGVSGAGNSSSSRPSSGQICDRNRKKALNKVPSGLSREENTLIESIKTFAADLRQAADTDISEDQMIPRNQQLVKSMKTALAKVLQRIGDEVGPGISETSDQCVMLFDTIRCVSAEFREGQLSGEDYARRLFDIFHYQDAPYEERIQINKLLVELVQLLPDHTRRHELASAASDRVEQLMASELRSDEAGSAVSRGSSAADVSESLPSTPKLETVACDAELPFPSLDGSDGRPTTGVLGGAWLSRPDLAGTRVCSNAAARADCIEHFPSLGVGQAPPLTGAWAGIACPKEESVATVPENLIVKRKTKRGTLLLHFG